MIFDFIVINYTSGETKRARTAYTRHQVLGKFFFIKEIFYLMLF